MQEVGVHGIGGFLFFGEVDGDLVFGAVLHEFVAGIEGPFAPGGDDLDAGVEGVGAELEADLVVAFAGGTVGDGLGTGFCGDFD